MHNVTRRAFGKLSTTIAAFALGLIVTLAGFAASAAESESNRVIHWDSFLFPPLSCSAVAGPEEAKNPAGKSPPPRTR